MASPRRGAGAMGIYAVVHAFCDVYAAIILR